MLSATSGFPWAEAGRAVRVKPTAVCPRCDREQTINIATTALTELHYCLVCRQSFVMGGSSAERVAEPLHVGQPEASYQARHPAAPAPPHDSWSGDGCHWFWRYPGAVIGSLVLASLLLYMWGSL